MLTKIKKKIMKKFYHKELQFLFFRVRHLNMKSMQNCLKRLQICVKTLNKIDVPMNEKENEVMKKLLTSYDEAIADLNKEIMVYRSRIRSDDAENLVKEG